MQKYKVYINNSPEIITESWKSFCANYVLIEAAGGLVYNNRNQLLMIFRDGKWDLPKGKVEDGENIEQCAIREVEEECGVSELIIINQLKETYHTYEIKGQKMLKCTYWFKMKSLFNGNLTPQNEEGITEVVWVSKKNLYEKLTNSFSSIKDLFKI